MIDTKLFKIAIRNKVFRDFLKNEMKLSNEQVRELAGCGTCIVDWVTALTERSLEKVNAHLILLDIKIVKKINPVTKGKFKNIDDAISWMKKQGDFTEIIIGIKKF